MPLPFMDTSVAGMCHPVTNMSSAFHGRNEFNEDIGNWDVSNVTEMHRMFGDAESFNQYIGDWNTSSVIEMSLMFDNAKFL